MQGKQHKKCMFKNTGRLGKDSKFFSRQQTANYDDGLSGLLANLGENKLTPAPLRSLTQRK